MSRGLRKRWKPKDQFLVRHKDRNIIVVEKAAGLLTVKTPSGKGPNLVDLLRDFLGTQQKRGYAFACHRLDRVVSGLLVFARDRKHHQLLTEQFAAHTVERKYIAVVDGLIPDDSGTFESWMRSHPKTLRMFSDAGTNGKHAVTHWRVLQRFESSNTTELEVQLETGARNQIRVHFAEAGFPLLGERKYLDADQPGASLSQGRTRIFLHAAVLGFDHPRTTKAMRFTSDLPPDLVAWKKKLAR